ncbi:phosphotransferase enzyme family protein [Embleya hyalina]|uniref:Aminoglycoside phosphotransferase n=1 Tax=Embleya hyalina TaxID=516124 RepID=A0A401YS75_9ACTN|nr:aminoglycoside phosphotransferase family protein [Embleya hyalina]GCD97422.1 aminoglycoside phosphotransferase [Embleya hyalina]
MIDSVAGERSVLVRACAEVEVPSADATLLSFGENAVFALPGPGLVARVARGAHLAERARREIAVACWLAEQDFPAVRPAAGIEARPVLVDGRPVTFWELLPPAEREPNVADLARLLRKLHALPAPPFALPARDPLALVETWLDSADAAVGLADRRYLSARRDALEAARRELTPALPTGLIHGDALLRNVGVHGGRALLLDWETVAHDLREFDLVLTPMAAARYGLPDGAERRFARKYGFDVTEWPGYPVLRDTRELAATAWVAQHVPGNPAAEEEFHHRVRTLRTGDTEARWHAF